MVCLQIVQSIRFPAPSVCTLFRATPLEISVLRRMFAPCATSFSFERLQREALLLAARLELLAGGEGQLLRPLGAAQHAGRLEAGVRAVAPA